MIKPENEPEERRTTEKSTAALTGDLVREMTRAHVARRRSG